MSTQHLPEKHRDEWFTRHNQDTVNTGMALYDYKHDRFYAVFDKGKYSVELHTMDKNHVFKYNIQEIEDNLYDRFIPCEVRG